MDHKQSSKELHHEIFGSILDRTEMTPFLLLPARDYATALSQAAKMMGLDNTSTLMVRGSGSSSLRRSLSDYFKNSLRVTVLYSN